jgi:hypothetical protein
VTAMDDMRADILQDRDTNKLRVYLLKKFKSFNVWYYPKSSRDSKCINYWVCASEENQRYVAAIYQEVFHADFPQAQARQAETNAERKAAGPTKVSQEDWIDIQEKRGSKAQQLLDTLLMWRSDQAYQEGERFFNQMEARVKKFDPSLVNSSQYLSEAEVKRVARLTGSTTKSAREVQAEFEGMIGIQQSAKISFEATSQRWGEINAVLQEDFRAGAWASGNACAALSRKGFKMETQAAVAFGAELNIDGRCTWKQGANGHGLDLSGNLNLFAGANASFDAKLSASLFKGINASLNMGAFAGVQASVTGRCACTFDDHTMAAVEATASVQFGVGGQMSANLNVPLFGATQIGFSTSASLGLGFGVSTKTEVHFTAIYLAGKEDFRKLMYLPTIAKGYRMDLMTQQAKNLHYLDKCIARITDGVTDIEESVASVRKLPEDQQKLLMTVSDDWSG